MIKNLTGIIIKKRSFIENDLIIVILDQEGNRIETVAKGAATPRSKRKSHLDLMNLISGTLYEGKSHLYLQDVQCQNSFIYLKEDYDHIMRMQAMLEIIEKSVLESDPHPEIYELLLNTLNEFNSKQAHTAASEISMIKLAHFLGFLPSFKDCSRCHKRLEADEAYWHNGAGMLACSDCSEERTVHLPLKYRKALEFFKLSNWQEAHKVKLSSDEAKVLRQFIPGLFASGIDREIKSMSYFK